MIKIANQEKGITLMVLIITIIVMLILVGVTINVALNGGLFDTAKEANAETNKQVTHEQILLSMKLTAQGQIDVDKTVQNVQENYPNAIITDEEDGKIVSIEGNEFIITNEKITEYKGIWNEYGLVSGFVFDKKYAGKVNYSRTEMDYELKFNSDGSFDATSGGMTSEELKASVNDGSIHIEENSFTSSIGNGAAIAAIGLGTKIEIYIGSYDIANPKPVEQTEENYAGELILIEE